MHAQGEEDPKEEAGKKQARAQGTGTNLQLAHDRAVQLLEHVEVFCGAKHQVALCGAQWDETSAEELWVQAGMCGAVNAGRDVWSSGGRRT